MVVPGGNDGQRLRDRVDVTGPVVRRPPQAAQQGQERSPAPGQPDPGRLLPGGDDRAREPAVDTAEHDPQQDAESAPHDYAYSEFG